MQIGGDAAFKIRISCMRSFAELRELVFVCAEGGKARFFSIWVPDLDLICGNSADEEKIMTGNMQSRGERRRER
jgi:hypothetical protein